MRCLRIIIFLFFIQISSFGAYSQIVSDTVSASKDGYVSSGLFSSSNYGSTTTMFAGRSQFVFGYYTSRSVVEFDFSSIPSNAIIKSATLKLKQTVTGTPTIYTARLNGNWYEDSITWANQPAYETSDQITSSSVVSGWHTVDVKNHVQKMVAGVVQNNGWILFNNNETLSSNTYKTFNTKEHGTPTYHPELIIDYYIPITVSSATIVHESSTGFSDGSVSPILADGPGGLSYKWYNSNDSLISTNLNLTGVPYGWYGLEVSSTNTSDKFYYAFIVGLDCEKVDIYFNSGPDYIDDVALYDFYPETNYGNYDYVEARDNSNYDRRSLLKFRLWLSDDIKVDKSDLNLTTLGMGHYYSLRTNECTFYRVTETWNEMIVTHSIMLSTTSSDSISLPSTTSTNQSQTIDISALWNIWKNDNNTNNGVLFQLDLYNNVTAYQRYYSSDFTVPASRPNIDFTIDLTKEPVSMVWDTLTQLGEIAIDLDKVCVKTGPYKYMISEDTIPDLGALYTAFNDSIYSVFYGTSLDSTSFFDGTTDLTKSFTSLQPGIYFVAVYDSTWTRIVDEEILVHGEFELLSEVNLELNENVVSATSGDAYGALNIYVNDESDSEIIFQFSNYNGTQYVGYSSVDSTVYGYNNLLYGFYAIDDSLYTVDNGSLSGGYTIVDSTDVLSISITDTILSFKINGVVISSVPVPVEYLYKVNVKVDISSKLLFKPIRVTVKLPRYRFNVIDLQHLACDGTVPGNFEFQVTPFLFLFGGGGGPYTVTYYVKDELDNLVVSGSTTSNLTVTVDEYSSSASLMPGKYKVYGTMNGFSYTEYITLGYEANWNQVIDYDQTPNSYSLKRTITSTSDFISSSFAGTKNFLHSGISGWTEFTALRNNPGVDLVRFSTQNISSMDPGLTEDLFAFVNLFGLNLMVWRIDGVQDFAWGGSTNSKVRIEFNTSDVSIFVNGTPIVTETALSANRVLRFQSLAQNNGFRDVITSFPCPVQSLDEMSHAELKRKLDGGFTYAVEDKLLFTFDEEYKPEATDVVKLNIYSNSYQLIGEVHFDGNDGGTGAVSDDYEFDDNKRQIDISGISGITLNEYYILEVITSKGEKLYLRFLYKS